MKATGYHVVTDGWGIELRENTRKCWHCQTMLFFGGYADQTEHFCRGCMEPVCQVCANKPCDHWEKKLDREEATGQWLLARFGEKLERASTDNELRKIDAAIERARFLRSIE